MLEEVQTTTLRNGATVVTCPCEKAESVAFGIFVGTGSRYERPAQAGASHFLEHMLFKGTPTRSALDISRALEGRGGLLNAFTGEDATCFHVRLPYEYRPQAVDVLMDMYNNASIRSAEFERERDVIVEEIKMYRDQPQWVVQENFQQAVYCDHPLGAPISGTEESLAAMTPEALRAYKEKMYRPSSTVFSFAGRLTHDRAVEQVTQLLEGTKKTPVPSCRQVDAGVKQLPLCIVRKEVQQIQAVLGFRIFGQHDDRRFAMRVMDSILGDNMSSRLFQTVREKRGLCYSIQSSVQYFNETGMFTVSSGFDTRKAKSALRLIASELVKITEKKVGAAELKRAKDYLIGTFRMGLEGTNSQMMYAGMSLLTHGRFIDPQERIRRIQEVTSEDLQRLAGQIFDPSRMTLALLLPNEQTGADEEWLDTLEDLA